MRLLRVVLSIVFLSSGLVVTVGAGQAFACSCAYTRFAVAVGAADEIVVGTLTDIERPPAAAVMSSTDTISYTVAVEGVHRGEVGSTVVFESALSGASCGLEGMVVDRRYLVLLSTRSADRTASLCSGTGPATPQRMRVVERLAGPPEPPSPSVVEEPTAGVAASAAAPSDDPPSDDPPSDDPPGEDASAGWLAGVVAVLVTVLLVASAGRRRRLGHRNAGAG